MFDRGFSPNLWIMNSITYLISILFNGLLKIYRKYSTNQLNLSKHVMKK